MHKISIIVPVFNEEQFLPACLDSIINQTYCDLEIIVINDGSTDSSRQICDIYAAKDHRIKVHHKSNEGVATARNVGLEIATGDFIGFVDSDDLIANNFYAKLLDILLVNDADIVECDFFRFKKNSELTQVKDDEFQSAEVLAAEDGLKRLMDKRDGAVAWNKVYKKEVIVGVNFPKGKYIDDEYWTYRVFGNAKKIVNISDTLYFYRLQADSIMGRGYSVRRLDGLQALEERIYYMKENYPSLENLAIKKFCFGAMFHFGQLYENKDVDPIKIYRKKILRDVTKYNKWALLKKWHWKDIIWYQLFLHSPTFYIKLKNLQEVKIKNKTQ